MIPLTVVGAEGKPLNGACMTSAGTGVSRRLRHRATSSTRRCRSCARRRRSAGSRPSTACTWARARSTRRTRTRSAPTARSSPAPASPARRCSRPATSTAGRRTYRSQALRQLREARGVGEVRRLRVHPGLRRRLHGGVAQRAGRHARAQLPQAELRGGRRRAGARSRSAMPVRVTLAATAGQLVQEDQ